MNKFEKKINHKMALSSLERIRDFDIRSAVSALQATIHEHNQKWWHDLHTGKPVEITVDLVLSKIALIHSELSEAVEGHRKDLMDDHLPDRKMIEVELADSIIRTLDLAAALNLDIAGAIMDKCEYNTTRSDHSIEHRKSENGKKA